MVQATRNNRSVGYGLRVGLPLAVFTAVITALYDVGLLPSLIQAVEFLIVLVGFFIAGMLAAKATGRIVSGLLSGLIAGVFVGIVIPGASIVMALVAPTSYAEAFGYHGLTSGELVTAAIVGAIGGLILWAILGLVTGFIGGLVGRMRSASLPLPTA